MSETKTKNLCTVPAADLTDSQYFIAEDGGELKRIPKVQVVLKKLENMLATDTENLAGGGEVTAQELLDALAEQVANKLLAKSQVVNNLLATVEGNPLDATQGKALKELIDTTNNNLSNYDKNNVNSPTIADCNSPGVKEGTLNENSKNTPNTEGLTAATEGHLSTIFPNRAGSWNAQMALYNGKNPCVFLRGSDTEWAKWLALATKSDLNKNGAQIGSLLKVYHGESSDKQNKVTLTTSATHMCGFLIIDQNNQTDVYVIGVNSGVKTLCKTSAENTPVISKNSSGCTLEIPLKTWSSFVFLSFYSCNISTTLM